MKLVFQIPIIDLRQVRKTAETIPVWPSADMSKDQLERFMSKAPFIRNFGKIQSSAEGYYCNINCVKYYTHSHQYYIGEQSVIIYNSYKHLYKDGIYTTKAEFGFSDHLEETLNKSDFPSTFSISNLLQNYLNMPVGILSPVPMAESKSYKGDDKAEWWNTIKLSALGSRLAKNYAIATAKERSNVKGRNSVIKGELCITLTYAANEMINLPGNAEKLDEFFIGNDAVKLYGYKLSFGGQVYKIWLFEVPSLHLLESPLVKSELQKRQSNLFRLNAEKETIRVLVGKLKTGNTDPELKRYIKKTPIKIFKKERFSVQQDPVREFALQSEPSHLNFATIDDLKKLLDQYGFDNLKNLTQDMKKAPPQKSILFITSNPSNSAAIDFGEQFKKIVEAWKSGTERAYYNILNIASAVERDKMMEILYVNKPDFLHINLHASEIKGLYFQDSKKNADPMSAEEFSDYIKQLTELKRPEAVILCACNSLPHALAIKNYCKYAVGTNYVFPDDAGIVYARKFYTALFNGLDISYCHKIAVQGIRFNKPPFVSIDEKEVYDIPQLVFPDPTT